VFDVLRKLIGDRAGLIAAAIFAVHPMMTEPVAYVFARATLLATLFSLLTMRSLDYGEVWIAVLWFRCGDAWRKRRVRAVPLVLMLCRSGRNWRGVLRRWFRWRWRSASARRSRGLRHGRAWGADAGISPLAYFWAQGVVIWRYLRLFRDPVGISRSILRWRASVNGSAMLAWGGLRCCVSFLFEDGSGS